MLLVFQFIHYSSTQASPASTTFAGLMNANPRHDCINSPFQAPDLPESASLIAFSAPIDGGILICGGKGGGDVAACGKWRPGMADWLDLPAPKYAHVDGAAVALGPESLIVVGGRYHDLKKVYKKLKIRTFHSSMLV